MSYNSRCRNGKKKNPIKLSSKWNYTTDRNTNKSHAPHGYIKTGAVMESAITDLRSLCFIIPEAQMKKNSK